MSKIKIATYFLNILSTLKMAHWMASDYNYHIILGNLYDSLSIEIDSIIEGLPKAGIPSPPMISEKETVCKTLEVFSVYLTKLRNKYVEGSVDTALQEVGKFFYLYDMLLQ
jgi:hypothetical protein